MLESDYWNSLSYICPISAFCKSVKKKKRILPLATAEIKLEDVWGAWKAVLSWCFSKEFIFWWKKLKYENCSNKRCRRERKISYVFLHNSQGKINCNIKKLLQESTLWTRSSHQLLHTTCIRKIQIVSHSYSFPCKRFTDISARSAEGRAAFLVPKAALQRSTRHCPPRAENSPLLSAHNAAFSFISSSFSTAVVLSAFARQGGNFKRLKETWSKDLQISITVSLFLHLCLKHQQQITSICFLSKSLVVNFLCLTH